MLSQSHFVHINLCSSKFQEPNYSTAKTNEEGYLPLRLWKVIKRYERLSFSLRRGRDIFLEKLKLIMI